MTRSTVFALMAIGLLSACAGQLGGPAPGFATNSIYSNSVGFTGVGQEPY